MCLWSHTLSWSIWCLLCGEVFGMRLQWDMTKSVILWRRRPAPECTCQNVLFRPSWTWHDLSWFMPPPFFGQKQKEFWMISLLSLSLVLCSETFGMDTLICSYKCLVKHHSLGIINQVVLWLYGSPPLSCVGLSRVCPWSHLQISLQLPMWNHKFKWVILLDFLPNSSLAMTKICHLPTDFISPQFHVVFNDLIQQFVQVIMSLPSRLLPWWASPAWACTLCLCWR